MQYTACALLPHACQFASTLAREEKNCATLVAQFETQHVLSTILVNLQVSGGGEGDTVAHHTSVCLL